MELTYRQLEATLTAHLQVAPDRLPTFRSRIKQLQRLKFPSGVDVGRGVKMDYSGAHLFKLVTAFELIGMGLPAQAVTQLVERHWEEFSAAYGLARRAAKNFSLRQHVYARLILRSLHSLQFSKWGDAKPSIVIVEDNEHLSEIMGHQSNRNAFCYPVLVASALYGRVTKIAEDIAGVSNATRDDEALSWLPVADFGFLMFRGKYPDRQNLAARRYLHGLFGNDPDSMTPAGQEEADAHRMLEDDDLPFPTGTINDLPDERLQDGPNGESPRVPPRDLDDESPF